MSDERAAVAADRSAETAADTEEEREPEQILADDYDRVANAYAARYADELEGKPFDRDMLGRFATLVAGGRVCEVGSGPGQVARFLSDRGVDVVGIDISPGMIEAARRANPGLEFMLGDMRELPISDSTLAGVVSFYSLVHVAPTELVAALQEFHRVLRPDGYLVLAVHEGDEVVRPGEMLGIPVTLAFTHFTREAMTAALIEAGFELAEVATRAPYPGIELETRRLYALAKRVEAPSNSAPAAVG